MIRSFSPCFPPCFPMYSPMFSYVFPCFPMFFSMFSPTFLGELHGSPGAGPRADRHRRLRRRHLAGLADGEVGTAALADAHHQ